MVPEEIDGFGGGLIGDLAYYVSVIALSVSVVALSRAREADRRADELYWDYIRLWGRVLSDEEDGE